jgi:cobalt-zinc-cadmium efflux system outer membrane protein
MPRKFTPIGLTGFGLLMKRRHCSWPLLLVAVFGSALSLPTKGQEINSPHDTNVVTLDALIADALEINPELRFYEAEIKAAKAGRKTAGLLANPEFTGSVGQKSLRGAGLSAEGVAWSVSVVQPFEWPGRIGLRKAIANRDVELAELGLSRFRVALTGRVRALAFGLFVAQEKGAAAREVADRFQALREVLVQRDAAGLTPLLETRIIEATQLTIQRKASEATLATQAALLELNQLRGVAPTAHLSLASTHLVFREAESVETLVALAWTNNFELRLRAVELAQQGFRVELAKNERFPALSVGPSISEERAGDRERIVGMGLSVPLPLWNRNKGNIEAAVARQLQAEVSLKVTERETQRKVVEAALIYETKLREMAKWRPDSVQHFKDAAELADRHYRLGAVPISIYVELQKQYLEAVESLLDTKKDALNSAQQLELLTGLPLPLANTSAKENQK